MKANITSLPRNVRVLSAVSFLQDAASDLIYPVLPLFITQTLGAAPAALGAIEGVAEGTAAIGKAVSGRLADRFRRKPLIAIGYGISALGKPLIALAGAWPVVLGARFVDRVGKGVRTSPRDALIAADTPPEDRGRAFGFHRAADSAGAVAGPLLGLGLYELLDHRLRPLFILAAIPAVASVACIAWVREHPPGEDPPGTTVEDRPGVTAATADDPPGAVAATARPWIPLRELPRRYWRVVGFLALFALLNFSDALVLLRAGELGLGFASIALVYALYNTVYSALSLPAGIVSDRVSRRAVFVAGLVPFAVAYIGLGLAGSSAWVWALMPVYGAFTALTDGVARAWVADLLPDHAMGTGIGVYQGLTGVGALFAGLWAGLAWGEAGQVPLVVSGAGAAVIALALGATARRR
jgi:MFS family permease